MIKSKKIIVATHYFLYGASHALRDYLNEKNVEELLFIGLPFHTQKSLVTEYYTSGKLIRSTDTKRGDSFELINYFYDFFHILKITIAQNKSYDKFIGVNNLNCLAGILLRRFGRVKKVTYYSIDFVPIRFPNKLLNYIYHRIEIFAVQHADEVWNVSPRIAEGRREFLNVKPTNKQIVVPIGVWNKRIQKLKFSKIKRHQIVFIGHLLEKQGVQEVIKAIPIIIKNISDFKLQIIGGGEYSNSLKSLVAKLKLGNYVEFLGMVKERSIIDKILSQSALATATYMPEKAKLHNFTYYADPTKIKDYLGAGLPIILTDVSYNARELEKKKCGVMVEYNSEEIANAIIMLLSNAKKLREYRDNALKESQEFDWENIFSKVRI